MIDKLSLTNFKAFSALDELDVRNLTIIVGRNSCGKSSIIQSLLLLKQTLESESPKPLCMEGRYLKLTNLKEISHGVPPVNQANIGYEIVLSENANVKGKVKFGFKNKKEEGVYSPSLTNFHVETNDEKLSFTKINKNNIKKKLSHFIKQFSKGANFDGFKLCYDKFLPELVELEFKEKSKDKKIEGKTIRFPLFPIYVSQMEIVSLLEKTLRNIKYLSPIRAKPERVYVHYSQDFEKMIEDGSNSAHIFWSMRNEPVIWKGSKIPLEQAVNECINTVGLTQELTPDKIGDLLYQVGISINNSKSNVSIADVGFGYSQVLPIILLGLMNNKENLMLIEQPEIHLHPSSAGNLADLFLSFAEDDKKFIIETHSQEFINKLRLRVIKTPSLKEKINIVFIEQEGQSSKIKQFEIDEEGMFPEWPDGFLDESESLARQILEARLGL